MSFIKTLNKVGPITVSCGTYPRCNARSLRFCSFDNNPLVALTFEWVNTIFVIGIRSRRWQLKMWRIHEHNWRYNQVKSIIKSKHEKHQRNFHRECSKCLFEPWTGIRCCCGRPWAMEDPYVGRGQFVESKLFSRVKINSVNWPACSWCIVLHSPAVGKVLQR